MSGDSRIWACVGVYCPSCEVPAGTRCKPYTKRNGIVRSEAQYPHVTRIMKWNREKPKRCCSLCHMGIKVTDKWKFGDDDRPQHKNCADPKYESLEQKEKQLNREMPLFDEVTT